MTFFLFLSEDLFKINEHHLEAFEAELKKLNEEIAKREKERESEPVCKWLWEYYLKYLPHICFICHSGYDFIAVC